MKQSKSGKALFLDRDGVINVEKNYVYRIEDFEFLPGIFDLCDQAATLGFILVVITNQAGIGRGYYTEADFQRLTRWMQAAFQARGIHIGRVYHCPYHPTAGIGEYRQESFDRKPNPGMLLKARDDLGLDLSQCIFIGDKDSDMAAGQAAGVGHLLKLVGERMPAEMAGKVGAVNAPPPGKRSTDQGVIEVASLQAAKDWLGGLTQRG